VKGLLWEVPGRQGGLYKLDDFIPDCASMRHVSALSTLHSFVILTRLYRQTIHCEDYLRNQT
jgi:hypothetical protein